MTYFGTLEFHKLGGTKEKESKFPAIDIDNSDYKPSVVTASEEAWTLQEKSNKKPPMIKSYQTFLGYKVQLIKEVVGFLKKRDSNINQKRP